MDDAADGVVIAGSPRWTFPSPPRCLPLSPKQKGASTLPPASLSAPHIQNTPRIIRHHRPSSGLRRLPRHSERLVHYPTCNRISSARSNPSLSRTLDVYTKPKPPSSDMKAGDWKKDKGLEEWAKKVEKRKLDVAKRKVRQANKVRATLPHNHTCALRRRLSARSVRLLLQGPVALAGPCSTYQVQAG